MDFKDFWYVLSESEKLKPGMVLGRKVLGEWLAVFRDETGKAVALQDRCLHRSAQISRGQVVDGRLACPYHGWTYNGKGQVVHVPAEGPDGQKFQKRCAKTFEVIEQQNYIYVRLNDAQDDIAPFVIPHYGEKGWRTIRITNHFKNNVTNCIENFVDVPHTVFVHPKVFRTAQYKKFAASVKRENGKVQVYYKNETNNLGWFSKFLNPAGREIVHRDTFHMPNITCVEYIFGPNKHFYITSQCIPETDDSTIAYTDLTFNYGFWNLFAGPLVRKQARVIIDQDIEILNNQMETIKRYDDKFSNTSADAIHVLIESVRDEIKKGGDPRNLPPKNAEIEFWV